MNVRAAVRRRLDPAERYGLRLTLFALAFLLVAVPFGWLLNQVERNGSLVRLDTSAAYDLHAWARESSWYVDALQGVSFLGSPLWLYLLVGATAAWLWLRHLPRLALFLVITALGGTVLSTLVKEAVNRPRPSLLDPVATAHGRSFPSGHAMSSVVVYGALLLILLPAVARRWRVASAWGVGTLVAAIGFSRLGLGVHFLSDVVGGWVLGLAWLAASTAAFSTWRVDRGRRPVEPLQGLEPEAAADLT